VPGDTKLRHNSRPHEDVIELLLLSIENKKELGQEDLEDSEILIKGSDSKFFCCWTIIKDAAKLHRPTSLGGKYCSCFGSGAFPFMHRPSVFFGGNET
jgi:hypothetical protein